MNVKVIKSDIKKRKKKVCAYARVSSLSTHQGESLENQIEYYKRKISANPEYELVDIFHDRAFTGTTEKRPEFQRMIKLCREGEIDLIYTKSVSRFARNKLIVLETARELKSIGVGIIFDQENIDTLSSSGELMLSIIASLYEEESRSCSENIKWRYRNKFKKGEIHINDKRFLGYDLDKNNNLIINTYECMVVKRIFFEYLKGYGTFKIAKMLNKEGLPTVTGAKWHSSTILAILKNEKYKGDVELQKTYIENHLTKRKKVNNGELDKYYVEDNHRPIISRDYWDKVQNEIRSRAVPNKIIKNDKKYSKRYPLSGMLYCSKCGFVLKRRIWNSKHNCRKIVWLCSNYIVNGKEACTGTTIEDDVVSSIDIKEPTIVREEKRDGKKHYYYSCKGK